MCQDICGRFSSKEIIFGYWTKLKFGSAIANEAIYDPKQLKCIWIKVEITFALKCILTI